VLCVIAAVVRELSHGAQVVLRRVDRGGIPRRIEAAEHRDLAKTKARQAEQVRLAAEERADRARKQQEEADEHRLQAVAIDPDVDDADDAEVRSEAGDR